MRLHSFLFIFLITALMLSDGCLVEAIEKTKETISEKSTSPILSSATVGMEGRVLVTIPGSPVIVKNPNAKDLQVFIVHREPKKEGTKYEIHYIGNKPARFNLASQLSREILEKNDSPLPTMMVKVHSSNPNSSGELIPAIVRPLTFFTSYQWYMGAVVVFWALCFIPLILWGRKKKVKKEEKEKIPPPSLEEILQPLLHAATKNQLDGTQKAQLEKATILKLREYLNLNNLSPYELIQKLKTHPKTSESITILERWLHHPELQQVSLSQRDQEKLKSQLISQSADRQKTSPDSKDSH